MEVCGYEGMYVDKLVQAENNVAYKTLMFNSIHPYCKLDSALTWDLCVRP